MLGMKSVATFMVLLLLSLLLPVFIFCGLSAVCRASGSINPMYGGFAIQTSYCVRGPGGSYGFFEDAFAEEHKREFGVGSAMQLGPRYFPLPMVSIPFSPPTY